jgi:hypothetical protein
MFQEPRMYSPARQPASGFKVRYAVASPKRSSGSAFAPQKAVGIRGCKRGVIRCFWAHFRPCRKPGFAGFRKATPLGCPSIPYGNASRPSNPLRVSYATAFSAMIDRYVKFLK